MVGVYLTFTLINLIVAALYASSISANVKLFLSVIPASILFLTPFVLTIPILQRFPKQNYFVVYQALYRLFRFTKPSTFALAIIISVLILALNFWAASIAKRTVIAERVPEKLRVRYLSYTAALVAIVAIFMTVTLYSTKVRNQDRQSCKDYLNREVPILDTELNSFFNDLTLYGQQAGTKELSNALQQFSSISRQYDAALKSDIDDNTLKQYEEAVAAAKAQVTDICSEFATD